MGIALIGSEKWMARVFATLLFPTLPHIGFLAHTCLKQASPPETALQPLSDHAIAFYVDAQLLGRKPPPHVLIRSTLRTKSANLNISVLNAVFFRRRTIGRFEAKPQTLYKHDRDAPVSDERTVTWNADCWQYGKTLI